MWRVFNFRAFLLTAICAIVVILSICLLPEQSGIILTFAIILTIAVGIIFIFARDFVKAIGVFLCAIIAIVISVNLTITLNDWQEQLVVGEEYAIEGKIERIYDDGSSSPHYLVGDVTANGKPVKGKMTVYVNIENSVTSSFLLPGDAITFSSNEVRFNSLISDAPNGYFYRDDVRYNVSVNEKSIKFVEDRSNFFDALRNTISATLNESMGEYGALAMGMITGDKGSLDDSVIDMYSAVGIGHILAVSGLHIGFLVLVINWILKKLKVNKLIRLIVSSLLLIFYCSLAFFSASAIRACIMCIVGLIADLIGERKDQLNTLSFAFTIVLCFKPLYLFDAGFLMSITAVFGIILFKDAIEKFFLRFLPKFLAPALAISISAQIGITPITLIAFSSFHTYSILSNLIVIPVVTVSFIVIMLALIITLILPFMGFLLTFSGILLALVDTIANFIAVIPFSEFIIFAPSALYFAYAGIFLVSRFFMLPKGKGILNLTLIGTILVVIVLYNLPMHQDVTVSAIAEYKSVTSIVRVDDGVIIVGDCKNGNKINDLLTKIKERKIKAVLVHTLDEDTVSGIVKIHEKFGVDKVYCPEVCDFPAIQTLVKKEIAFYTVSQEQSIFGFEPVIYEDEYYGYGYTLGQVSVLFTRYGQNTSKIPVSVINEFAIIRSYAYGGEFARRIYVTNYENSYLDEVPDREISTNVNAVTLLLRTGEIINL